MPRGNLSHVEIALASFRILFCVVIRVRAQPTIQPIAVEHVNVVDVIAGEIQRRSDSSHFQRQNQRGRCGGNRDTSAGCQSHQRAGQVFAAGLWDMHVHLRGDPSKPDVRMVVEKESMLDLFLPNTIVGIREMGGDLADQVIQWRNQIRAERDHV
jgi:hypothetical protein